MMMEFMAPSAANTPALNHAIANLKLDVQDLTLEFKTDTPSSDSRTRSGKAEYNFVEDIFPKPSLPRESRLRRILDGADSLDTNPEPTVDPEADPNEIRTILYGHVSPPNRRDKNVKLEPAKIFSGVPALDAACLESPAFPSPPKDRTPSGSPNEASYQSPSTSSTASTPTKQYILPPTVVPVSQIRNMQQQNRQAFQSNNQKAKSHKRNPTQSPKDTSPKPPPSPNAPVAGTLPIILVDPATGQPVGAVTPVAPPQPGMMPKDPNQVPIIGLVPQPNGPPAQMAFVSVPIPAAAMHAMSPTQAPPNPAQGMLQAQTPPSPNPRMVPQPFPPHMAPQPMPMSMGYMGAQMGPSPTYGMPAPPAAPQGGPNGAMGSMSPATSPPAVKPREKTILKIIDPESGQELTPEMINPGRHSQHALQNVTPKTRH